MLAMLRTSPATAKAKAKFILASVEIRLTPDAETFTTLIDSPVVDFEELEKFAEAFVRVVRATRRAHPELVGATR